ncbi:glutaredoxin domain-containing protein [Enterococcus faecalis]|uniref:Glutaredoxin n=1 Tax=Enterococcus phage vB_EfaS_IME196 TaxID=1747289 RepID=A0A0S2MYD3_9CAUD|nr:glutaredoxin domain-containing protein [Enterococcus faecalis]YP_009216609.1 thioredoxin domain [Enterococcus phage vB_EfaS_IME196]ALO80890.1 glutaredoxin [Enterococcus phage vB_EfaS_IME196]MCH1677440.1 NrdH-redoxin [Enterococcus faecalis]MCH1680232.1 NrdH-redoxin [Enterococcus faecalis]
MLTVYTKNNCFPCTMTKRKLQELGVNYKEINVDEDLAALEYLMECGLRSLPVVFKDDEAIITGGFAPNILETCVSEEDSKRISDSK